jgi:hypothetical protein
MSHPFDFDKALKALLSGAGHSSMTGILQSQAAEYCVNLLKKHHCSIRYSGNIAERS